MVFQESFKGVSIMIQGCFKNAQDRFKGNSRIQGSFCNISKMSKGCFKEVSITYMDYKAAGP